MKTVVTFGEIDGLPRYKGTRTESWDLPRPEPEDADAWQALAGEIQLRVQRLTDTL